MKVLLLTLLLAIWPILQALGADNQTHIYIENQSGNYLFQVENQDYCTSYSLDKNTLDTHIDQLLESMDNYLIEGRSDQYYHHAYWVYQQILEPIKNQLNKRIIIHANGKIAEIPWDALVIHPLNQNQIEYLMDKHLVTIETRKYEKTQGNLSFVHLISLAPQYSEALFIRNQEEDQFLKSLFRNWVLMRVEKLEELKGKQTNILHIGAHSAEDDEHNWLDTERDLGSFKLQFLFANTCRSARTDIDYHKQSIVNRFYKYGAQSSIGTLWNINDEAALQISQEFYRHMSRGTSTLESLQRSKKQFLENHANDPLKEPYYWAAYQHFGNEMQFEAARGIPLTSVLSIMMTMLSILSTLSVFFKSKLLFLSKNFNFL